MNVLSGIYPYGTYSGEIYGRKSCAFRDIRDSERVGIALSTRRLALQPYMSIAENLFLK